MTVDRLPKTLRKGLETDREHDGLPTAAILSMCDRLLGEVGRRAHMFAWLRPPGSSAGEWLAVDGYYPRSRLVVVCRLAPGPHDALYRELIPARGLGLLMLDPVALGEDPAAVEASLAARIFDLEHVPRPRTPPEPVRDSRPTARPGRGRDARPATTPEPRESWTPVKVERATLTPALEQGLGMVVGLALAAVLVSEVYLAAVAVAFGAGRPVLGFAIALEACSRGLGTLAAERAGEREWALACAVGGAPVVAWYALGRREGRTEVEPAPLAGLLALVAGLLALVALLIGS